MGRGAKTTSRPDFIVKAEQRAARRKAKLEGQQDAHVRVWHAMRTLQERGTVRLRIAMERLLTGNTGTPETISAAPKNIQNRLVPDPSMTDAEWYAQHEANQSKPNLGRMWAKEDALTRIGALAYIRRRLRHHEEAAERFKTLYEARYGLGNPALDPSRVLVDTSPQAHDSGMAAKIDRTNDIKDAEKSLGKATFDRLVAVVVLCIPAGEGQTSRPRQRSIDQLLDDLDSLSSIWGYKMRAA